MKSWGNAIALVAAFLLHAILQPGAPSSPKKEPARPKSSLVIAQITDPHIFDDGWKMSGSTPFEYAMDDRQALRWAVDTINQRARTTAVDFVVFTGDFGLENVFFSEPFCSQFPFTAAPGLAPFNAEVAASELALEFDRLEVPDIYVVAGNNDIVDEQVTDYPRFECFISRLQSNLNSLPEHPKGFKHIHIEELRFDGAVSAGSYRLAGLNTASFKQRSKRQECDSGAPLSPMLKQICPEPQIQDLRNLLNSNSTSPILLFTHVPDLLDPFKKGDPHPNEGRIKELEEEVERLSTSSPKAG